MKISLICDGPIKVLLDYHGVRFLGCVTLYFCRFPYCFFMECGCCWNIGWNFVVEVGDKRRNLNKLKILALLYFCFWCCCCCCLEGVDVALMGNSWVVEL
jgi:hypothetical protein